MTNWSGLTPNTKYSRKINKQCIMDADIFDTLTFADILFRGAWTKI